MAEVDGRASDRDASQLVSVASTDREPNRWAVLGLLSVAQLMVVLDATIVTIAIPSAQEALHFSTQSRQWIVTAYALAFGSLLLLGGKLGDLFGRKWALIAGLVGFSAAWRSPSACSWLPERSKGHSPHCSHPRRSGC
jgi:predicted MFS family arabinose efflux permease